MSDYTAKIAADWFEAINQNQSIAAVLSFLKIN